MLGYIQGVLAVIPLIVAVLSAILSFVAYHRSNKLATRSLFLEGQKFVLEIDRQLLADPHLWGLYDDRDLVPLDSDPNFDPNAPLFRGKLRAFAYLHLNMYEVMLAEGADRATRRDEMFKMWLDYFYDTLSRSSLLRSILDDGPQKLWNPRFLKLYNEWNAEWKQTHSSPPSP